MSASLDLTESATFAALLLFLADILPAGDAVFVASIDGDTMTVSTVKTGTLTIGDQVLGDEVAFGTLILADNGDGTWKVAPEQTVEAATLATGVEIIRGQVSRVPEPIVADYVVMTAGRRGRIETNVDEYEDTVFTASIADKVMTVTEVQLGAIKVGATVFGVDVLGATKIVSFGDGTDGGPGTYNLNKAQTIGEATLSAGQKVITQSTEFPVQLDVHGSHSADYSQIITTMLRDSYAAAFFADLDCGVAPLHADDAKQIPFPNAEQQWEDRWVIEAFLQVNPEVRVPQQFAGEAVITTLPIAATYPN